MPSGTGALSYAVATYLGHMAAQGDVMCDLNIQFLKHVDEFTDGWPVEASVTVIVSSDGLCRWP